MQSDSDIQLTVRREWMSLHQFNDELKAIYGVLVSVFPMVAAYLHPEVTQPQEPQRGDLPPPVVGNLRLAANQQLLSDRQAEVTAIVTQHRKELQKFRDQFRDMRNVLFTPE